MGRQHRNVVYCLRPHGIAHFYPFPCVCDAAMRWTVEINIIWMLLPPPPPTRISLFLKHFTGAQLCAGQLVTCNSLVHIANRCMGPSSERLQMPPRFGFAITVNVCACAFLWLFVIGSNMWCLKSNNRIIEFTLFICISFVYTSSCWDSVCPYARCCLAIRLIGLLYHKVMRIAFVMGIDGYI